MFYRNLLVSLIVYEILESAKLPFLPLLELKEPHKLHNTTLCNSSTRHNQVDIQTTEHTEVVLEVDESPRTLGSSVQQNERIQFNNTCKNTCLG